jgi:hypothetical protein
LLNIPFIQQRALRMVVSAVRERTDSEISIGRLQLDFLRGLSLKDVYFANKKGDTLIVCKPVICQYFRFLCFSQQQVDD